MKPTVRLISIAILLLLAQLACASSALPGSRGQNRGKDGSSATQTGQAATLAATQTGAAEDILTAKNDPHFGLILANQAGMTLYTYQQDQPGTSNCTEPCATIWPPLTVPLGTDLKGGVHVSGQIGTLKRADGKQQVTYNQLPLYLYSGDTSPQDVRGEGMEGSWDVIAIR
jgi:predicted lipoprotein with Yx(FWY)xxD motif